MQRRTKNNNVHIPGHGGSGHNPEFFTIDTEYNHNVPKNLALKPRASRNKSPVTPPKLAEYHEGTPPKEEQGFDSKALSMTRSLSMRKRIGNEGRYALPITPPDTARSALSELPTTFRSADGQTPRPLMTEQTQEGDYQETEANPDYHGDEPKNQLALPQTPPNDASSKNSRKLPAIHSQCYFYFVLLSFASISFSFGYVAGVLNPLLETIVDEHNFNFTAEELGGFFSMLSGFSWLGFLATTTIQPIVSRTNPRKIITFTIIVQFFGAMLVFSGSKYMLIASRSIVFCTCNLLAIYSSKLAFELAPAEKKTLTQNVSVCLKCIGMCLAYVVAGFDDGGTSFWKFALCLPGFFPLLNLLIFNTVLRKVNSPEYLIKEGRVDECRCMLMKYLRNWAVDDMIKNLQDIQNVAANKSAKKIDGKISKMADADAGAEIPKDGCCTKVGTIYKTYSKELGFSFYLGSAILFTFYPVLNDFSSILFIKDQHDMEERMFFKELLPLFTFFQLFLIIFNIKFQFTKKRRTSLIMIQFIYAVTWTVVSVSMMCGNFTIPKFMGFIFWPFKRPFSEGVQLTLINECCPGEIWSATYTMEQIIGVCFAFIFPMFLQNPNHFALICLVFAFVNLLLTICSYFMIFETDGLTQKQIYERFRQKRSFGRRASLPVQTSERFETEAQLGLRMNT